MGNPESIVPYQFKPGQSGNPNGRPKKLPDIDKLMMEALGEHGEEALAIIQALIVKAKKGDVRAAEVLLDRAFGKAKQEIDQKTTLKDERIDVSRLSDDELRVLAEIQRKSRISEAQS